MLAGMGEDAEPVDDPFPLPRVATLRLGDVVLSADSALARAVQRVRQQAAHSGRAYAAFGNAP